MRERRSAIRRDVLERLSTHLSDIKFMEEEMKLSQTSCDQLLLQFVVDRLSKGDYDGLKIFKNNLPAPLMDRYNEIVDMYEIMYGKPPSV